MQVAVLKVFAQANHFAVDSFLATSRRYLESPEHPATSRTTAFRGGATGSRNTANVSIKPIGRWIGLRIETQIKAFNLAMKDFAARESTCRGGLVPPDRKGSAT